MGTWVRDRNLFSTKFHLKPERRDEFIEIFNKLCKLSEPYYKRGCVFAFQGWGRDPNEFVVFASWDEDVVKELRMNEDFRKFNAAMLDCCSAPVEMEQFSGMEKDRSIFDAYPVGVSSVHETGTEHAFVLK